VFIVLAAARVAPSSSSSSSLPPETIMARGFPITGRNDAEGEAARALAEQRTGKIYVHKFIGLDSLRYRWTLATREEVGSVEWARDIMEAFERASARRAARASKAVCRQKAAPSAAKAKKGKKA